MAFAGCADAGAASHVRVHKLGRAACGQRKPHGFASARSWRGNGGWSSRSARARSSKPRMFVDLSVPIHTLAEYVNQTLSLVFLTALAIIGGKVNEGPSSENRRRLRELELNNKETDSEAAFEPEPNPGVASTTASLGRPAGQKHSVKNFAPLEDVLPPPSEFVGFEGGVSSDLRRPDGLASDSSVNAINRRSPRSRPFSKFRAEFTVEPGGDDTWPLSSQPDAPVSKSISPENDFQGAFEAADKKRLELEKQQQQQVDETKRRTNKEDELSR